MKNLTLFAFTHCFFALSVDLFYNLPCIYAIISNCLTFCLTFHFFILFSFLFKCCLLVLWSYSNNKEREKTLFPCLFVNFIFMFVLEAKQERLDKEKKETSLASYLISGSGLCNLWPFMDNIRYVIDDTNVTNCKIKILPSMHNDLFIFFKSNI